VKIDNDDMPLLLDIIAGALLTPQRAKAEFMINKYGKRFEQWKRDTEKNYQKRLETELIDDAMIIDEIVDRQE